MALALASAGRSMAARMVMMAMTTNNSINVKAYRLVLLGVFNGFVWSFLVKITVEEHANGFQITLSK